MAGKTRTSPVRALPAPDRPPPERDEVRIIKTANQPVREVLARYRIVPRKRFGQNFLHDPGIAARIVEAAELRPGDPVLEIGPGLGALTIPLLAAGAEVTAVEVDRRIADYLEEELGHEPGLRLVRGDVLELDPDELAPRPTTLVANLPYAITGPVVGRLIEHAARFPRAVIMVQKEVGQRLVAGAGGKEIGAPAVLIRLVYRVRKLFDVGRGAFSPRPDVVSTLVRLDAIPQAGLDDRLRAAVNAAYRQRRKMLRNTLAHLAPEELVARALASLGHPPTARPEDLEPPEWPRLLEAIDGGCE